MSDSMRTSDYYKNDLARCARDWAGSKTWPVPDPLRERLLQMADAIEELTKAKAAAPVGASLRELVDEALDALCHDQECAAQIMENGSCICGVKRAHAQLRKLREALASSPTPTMKPTSMSESEWRRTFTHRPHAFKTDADGYCLDCGHVEFHDYHRVRQAEPGKVRPHADTE